MQILKYTTSVLLQSKYRLDFQVRYLPDLSLNVKSLQELI